MLQHLPGALQGPHRCHPVERSGHPTRAWGESPYRVWLLLLLLLLLLLGLRRLRDLHLVCSHVQRGEGCSCERDGCLSRLRMQVGAEPTRASARAQDTKHAHGSLLPGRRPCVRRYHTLNPKHKSPQPTEPLHGSEA